MLLSPLCRVRRRLYRLHDPKKQDAASDRRVHLGDAARADGRRVDVEHVAPVGAERRLEGALRVAPRVRRRPVLQMGEAVAERAREAVLARRGPLRELDGRRPRRARRPEAVAPPAVLVEAAEGGLRAVFCSFLSRRRVTPSPRDVETSPGLTGRRAANREHERRRERAEPDRRLDDAREPEARPREVLQDVGVVVEVGARAAPLRENRGRRRRRRRGLEHARVARPRHDAAARDGADAHAEEAALRPARHDERPCGS